MGCHSLKIKTESKSRENDLITIFSVSSSRLISLSEQHFLWLVATLAQHVFSSTTGTSHTSTLEKTVETAAILSPQ